MKWDVQITGDVFDLRELSKSLVDDELRVFERNGQYCLESNTFETLTTPEKVSSLAKEILQVLTGAVRLSLGGRTPLHVANIARLPPGGDREVFLTLSDTIHARTTMALEIVKANGTTQVVGPADKVPGWVRLGLGDSKVAKALRLLGTDEHNWVSLYRLYEVIEEDVGGVDRLAKCGWAARTAIRRFKYTANSPGAVGDASRHGKESTTPPTDPMDISEARALVELILHNWLRSKVP